MTIIQKIQIILKEGVFTQDKLAQEIGVSTVTVNRWVNGLAVPYKKHHEDSSQLEDLIMDAVFDGFEIMES